MVGVGVMDGVRVFVIVGVRVMVAEGTGVRVPVAVRVAVTVGLSVGVNVGVSVELDKNETAILTLLRDDPEKSTARIADTLGVSSRTIDRALKSMKEKGVIKREGAHKNGYWVLLK